MAILHGSWLLKKQDSCLFVWGETWRSRGLSADKSTSHDVLQYPLFMTQVELLELMRLHHITIGGSAQRSSKAVNLPTHSQIIALPTYFQQNNENETTVSISPLHSATVEPLSSTSLQSESAQYLQPWQVEGFCLNPQAAMQFLTSLPLSATNGEDAFVGGDLRFWAQIARWSLDLISRCKFLPTLQRQPDNSIVARWQALLDSALDGTRLEKFSQLMPLACRMYQEGVGSKETTHSSVDFPQEPQELLLGFLNSTIDAQIRAMVGTQVPVDNKVMASLPGAVRQWLHSLSDNVNHAVTTDPFEGERLEATLKAWTLPLQYQLAGKSLFRTCFQLLPPESDKTDWTLAYFLQAADDSNFLVDATTIWNHPVEQLVYQNRTIEQPQEIFLRGLGLASRLYP